MSGDYSQAGQPHQDAYPFHDESRYPPKKRTSPWLKFGVPVAILVIAGAVVAGVLVSRKHHSGSSASSSDASGPAPSTPDESAVSAKNALGKYATATDSEYMMPIYVATTDTAAFTTPTFVASAASWPEDPFKPSSPDVLTVRTDRPRLIAPAYKWAALPDLIKKDVYLASWNASIFANATEYRAKQPVQFFNDSSSGILDNAREIKQRVKAFSYVWRMTKDTAWADRLWEELQNAAGEGSTPFGPDSDDKWNPGHFLDVAELSAAFGIAYDWLYDIWTADQKTSIRTNLLRFGLKQGVTQVTTGTGWWRSTDPNNLINGNWNCVCNSGLTIGSLAILGDDDSGVAEQLLKTTVDNAKAACAQGPSSDGTWSETANYWYFGTTGHAEMSASLQSATGSSYGLLTTNPNFQKTGLFHMAITGATSLFNYGDHGPNKFSTTANSMFFYAQPSVFNQPQYALFQRDQADAPDPFSMFWYDPSIAGAFWDGLELDTFFDNDSDQWAAMRSTWTDVKGLYVAMKAGQNLHHQNHNDLDCGDFVVDALGTRWAGELGSGDYNSPNYFLSDAQDADRWKYYRKMTEGQNTLLIGATNQRVDNKPTVKFDSSATKQGPTTVFKAPQDSTAFFTTDMTSSYFNVDSVKRGIRLLNGRRQILLQDEVTASQGVMWRMHTNATVSLTSDTAVDLALDGEKMTVQLLNAPSGAKFSTSQAVRLPSDVQPPAKDQDNPGVTVLIVDLPAGTYNLQVLFNPQWPAADGVNYVSPKMVPLDQWSLTSHS